MRSHVVQAFARGSFFEAEFLPQMLPIFARSGLLALPEPCERLCSAGSSLRLSRLSFSAKRNALAFFAKRWGTQFMLMPCATFARDGILNIVCRLNIIHTTTSMHPKEEPAMPRKPTPPSDRKYDEMQKGKTYWHPGEDHPMDKLAEELEQLRERIPGQLEQLRAIAQRTEERLRGILEAMPNATDDPTALFAPAEHAAVATTTLRFHNRKHLGHLLTIFQIQRAGRTLGRLQAIAAALDLANGLLEEEEAFSAESLAIWRTFLQDQEEDTSAATTEPSP